MIYKYRYHYNSKKQPVVTECGIYEGNLILAVGVAICSKQDHPCKKQGRKIARQRADHALASQRSKLPILGRAAVIAAEAMPDVPVMKSIYWR